MLRINQQRSASGALSYFDESLVQGDYYAKDAIEGRWFGRAAEKLGLDATVTRESFQRLCDNLHPSTAEQLTARHDAHRTVGYDFNFHCPKSLSILYGLTRDERLLTAFQNSVRETMQEIEKDAATRVRQGGQNAERNTGQLVWGEFVHLTSRPVNGIPDPHLHAHCFVFNATYDSVEQKWKAAQFRNIVRDAPYYEAAFHARLSQSMTQLGLWC
jgi:conjugative relaxase-like TrwC/TraI family protein